MINSLTALVTSPFAGLLPGTNLNGGTVARELLLRPFPHFTGTDTGVRQDFLNDGSSYFHMFQVRVEKRLSAGLSFLGNYQASKLIEKRSRLNEFDSFLEKRPAGEDRPHRFVFSASYDMPFGKGKRLGANAGSVLSRIIGGWNINGIYTLQPVRGPLTWRNVIYLGGDLNYNRNAVDGTFDITRFNRASNLDASIIKNTSITEGIKLQYRCEVFNVTNHPTFNGPELSPTNTNFGRITSQANLARIVQMALRLVW